MAYEDNRKWLYDQMKQSGVDLPSTYEEFSSDMDMDDRRDWYYNAAKDAGIDVGPEDEFRNAMMATPTNSVVETKQQPMDTSRLDPKYQLGQDGNMKPFNLLETEKALDENGNTITKPKLVKGADGTDVYRNAMTGEEYNPLSPEAMEMAGQNTRVVPTDLKRANREQVAGLRDDIARRISEREKEISASDVATASAPWYMNMDNGTGFGGNTLLGKAVDRRNRDTKYRALNAAYNSINDAQAIIDEADKAIKEGTFDGFVKGAGRGFGNKLFDVRTWDMGVTDLQDNAALFEALNKADNGKELSEEERIMLDAKATEMATVAYFGSYLGNGYKAGEVTAASIPFMLETAINPASTAGNSAQAMLARYAMKRLGKKAALEALEKGTEGAFKQGLKELGKKETGKILLGRLAGDLAGSAAMAGSTGATGVLANTYERMAGDMNFNTDENGNAVYGGHENYIDKETALKKAFIDRTIQNYSEMFGAYLSPMIGIAGKGLAKGLEKIGLGKVNDFIEDVAMSDVARIVSDFESKTKWNGLFEEYAEEVAGNVMNALTIKDMTLDTTEGTGVFNLDQNIETFLGVSLMGGFLSGVKTIGYRTPKYRARKDMNKAGNDAAMLFDDKDAWETLKNTISQGTDEEARGAIAEVLTSDDYTDNQKASVLKFAQKAETYKGVLKGNTKRMAEEEDIDTKDVQQSYENGQELNTPQDKNDALNMYQLQRDLMSGIVGEDTMNDIDKDPLAWVVANRDNLASDDLQAALDYVNAKATYDGMIDRVRDDIDEQTDASDKLIDRRVMKDGANVGSIVPATMKTNDRQVYVISGNVKMIDDGSMVDKASSDGAIFVMDAQTGKVESVSADDILRVDTAIPAEQEKATAREAITQQIAQEQANQMEGVLPFNVGDEYALVDDQGVKHTAKVIADNIEGNTDGVVVLMDGVEMPTTKDKIQKWSQLESKGRAVEYVAKKNGGTPAEPAEQNEQRVYAQNDEVMLRDADGNAVRGTIVSDPNADGLIEIETATPILGKPKVGQWTPEEIDAAIVEHNGETVQNLAESVPDNAESVTQTAESVPNEPMPMVGDEPDFLNTTPERGYAYLFNESKLEDADANAILANNVKSANSALTKIKGQRPKAGTSVAKFNSDIAKWNQKMANAEKAAKYWEEMQKLRNADQKIKNDAAIDKAREEEAAYAAEQAQKAAEQAQLGSNNVAPAIRDKWNNAPKTEGVADEIVLANGEKVAGKYYLVESGAASASHDANNGFVKTEGFPVDENGNSVNDRDYERDQDAQRVTRQIADNYDSRALQTPVVVSQDGVVLSGNGRTMAGELAAANNTDGAYVDYLKNYGQRWGFTTDQVGNMQHPRVVFVPNDAMPYTAETFAMFNQQEMKSQSKTEQAVKLGKVVDDATFGRIIDSINKFETLAEFYADNKAATNAIDELQNAGALSQAQRAEMFDGDNISETGRSLLENMLIGKAFESNPDAVREISEYKSMRQSIVMALAEVSNNLRLGEDFSLEEELAQAIDLVYQARKGGYKFGDRVSGYALQQNLGFFGDNATVADYTQATVLMLADVLNDNGVKKLKTVLQTYNRRASSAASNQLSLDFAEDVEAGSGEIETKEQIINDVIKLLNINYDTARQEGAQGVQQNGTDGRSSEGSQSGQNGSGSTETAPERKGDLGETSGVRLSDEVDENGKRFVLNSEGSIAFGTIGKETGLTPAPIQLSEGMITDPATNAGYGLVHIEARHGEQIRKAGYNSVLEFVEEVAKNYQRIKEANDRDGHKTYLLQLTDRHNNTLIVELVGDGAYWTINTAGIFKKSYGANNREVYNRHTTVNQSAETDGRSLDKEQGGTPSSTSMISPTPSEEGKLPNATALDAETTDASAEQPTDGGSAISSQRKVSNNSATEQPQVDETDIFSQITAETESEDANSSPVAAAIAAAESETDTNPSEAQKEAGNYKKGHVKVDGYDITIENPKGSVRSGKDADGKEWSVTMNNTYGYIRGTEGVDGDHIDVFLSDNPELGNVYVVDQVDADGNFDEHKVMYGFNSAEEARDNYLANYSEGWKMGTITEVSKEEFKKWIESSHRKTKPFSEYKSVKKEGAQSEAQAEPTPQEARDWLNAKYDGQATPTDGTHAIEWIDELSDEDALVMYRAETLGSDPTKTEDDAFEVFQYFDDLAEGVTPSESAIPILEKYGKKFEHPATVLMANTADEQEDLAMTPDEPKEKKTRTRKPSDAKTDEKIEDVGEKIEGARKDMVFNYTKKGDTNGTKLSEIFPKPNFASMLKSGVSLDVLAEVKALYMLCKAFSKKKRYLKSNLNMIRMMGTAARYILSKDAGLETDAMGQNIYGKVIDIVGARGYVEAVRRVVDELGTEYLDVDFTDTPVPGMASFAEDPYGYYIGPDGKTYIKTTLKVGNEFYYLEGSRTLFETMDDAWKSYVEQVRKSHQTTETKPKHKMSVYYTPGVKNSFYIAVKINKDVIKLKDGFENSKDAFKYMSDYNTELNAEIERIAEERRKGGERGESNVDIERKIRNIVERDRVGRDWRNGADVSEEDFMNTFGFRGVQFGNWASQKERQMHLNKCYDAFMDLSEVLGISPKSLGLGGELGFAFGARGRGTALAHYEPGSNVINLTKNRGAGCVAHEWFHALDFYLSKDMRPATTGKYKTETRDELKKVFDGIMKSIRGTEYYEFARKIDSTKDNPYWSEPTELSARAFEAFVKTRLAEKGQTDDYLSSFVANEDGSENTGEAGFYPVGDELQKIGEAFQNVFDTMEERVGDDGKSYLFQIGAEEPGTDNVTPAQQLATEAIITALGENAGLDVVMESQEDGQRVASVQNADTEMMALSNNEQEFDSMKKMAHDEKGHVMPGLAEKTVTVVPLNEHGFGETFGEAIKKAKEWAKSNLAGKEYDFPEGGKYVISNKAIGKYLSSSAFTKSDNSNVHLAALRMLPEIIGNSMDAEIHEDYKKGEDGKRNVNNGVENENKLVHRLYGAVTLGDKTYRVKTTMYEYRAGELKNNTPHSYEITEIELLDSPVLPAEAVKNTIGISNNSISGAKLLKNVEKSYDKGVKLLDIQPNTAEFMQVWHGSAAVFDHFDGAFMGTGEGSQAYGNGHYVSQTKGIAKSYAELVADAKTPSILLDGKEIAPNTAVYLNMIVGSIKRQGYDIEDAISDLEWSYDTNDAETTSDSAEKRQARKSVELLRSGRVTLQDNSKHLYEVEIPDDNGENYLSWKEPVTDDQLERIAKVLKEEDLSKIKDFLWKDIPLETREEEGDDIMTNGEYLKEYLSQEHMLGSYGQIQVFLENKLGYSPEYISKSLSKAGIVGIKVPTNNLRSGDKSRFNYVIFKDSDLKITDRVQFMQRPEGTVYGWSEGNRIHLTPEGINPNTPIHEYTHLWSRAVMQKNPKLWNRIKELLQGTPIWEEVVNDPAYQGLTTDDAIASEALSRLSGRKNAGKMEKMAQDLLNEAKGNGVFAEANAHTLILKMKQALKDFWKWVGTNLFDMNDVKNIDEVTDRVLYDLLNKTDLALSENGDAATEFHRDATLDEVNDRYNEQLAGYTTENADSVILNLGMPSEILKKAGVEDKPMKLYGSKIAKKQKKHGFDVNDLRDLPRAMANPIAVFDNYGKEGNRSVLTELKTNNGNILVAVDLGKEKDIDFNIIASAFGKGKSNVEDWLGKGFATYINNEKVQDYLNLAAPIAAAADNTELSTGAKVQPNNELNKFLGEKLYIRTENFKNWFGDWQKDPKSASKVVDKNGEPLVVYHGTKGTFNTFAYNPEDIGFHFGNKTTARTRVGKGKDARLMPVYLDIKNPLVIDTDLGAWDADYLAEYLAKNNLADKDALARVILNDAAIEKFGTDVFDASNIQQIAPRYRRSSANANAKMRELLKGIGYDGIEYSNYYESNGSKSWIALVKSQIKSATDNNGEFDAENADIRFRERTEFDDGEVIDIVGNRGSQDYSLADSTMPSYRSKEELLHAFQEKHPAYAAVLTADGNGIEVTAWKSVLDKNIRKPRRRNGEPTKAEKQRAAYVERKTQIAIANVNEKAQKLGLNVEVITDTEGLPKNMADKKGWYNKVTGKITIVLPNHSNGQDVMRTLMHEGVAHHGLRQMFGEDFNTFLDNVYANADIEVRRRIAELAARKGWDFHVATEEYMAALAEDIDFERKVDQTWWQKVKFFFIDMLRKAGIVLDDKLTDNDLRYIVWKSYERMAYAGEYGAIRDARTVMMDQQLGTGNFGTRAVADGSQVADGSELLFRGRDQRDHATIRDSYEREIKTATYQMREAVQDSMLSLRRMMEEIEKATGNKIADYENAYMAENALSSKNLDEQRMYKKMLFEPMLDEVYRLAKEEDANGDKPGRDGVTRYMMAKHGLERQKLMEARAEQAGEKSDRDFAGLTGLFETDDLADAIQQAEQLVADFESAHKVDDLWKKVNNCTKSTLEKSYKCGIISKEGYERISKMYDFYIPLRGFKEDTSEKIYAYLNHETGSFQNPMKGAHGRETVASDIFANILNMADSAIAQGNKNLVKQKFLKMVMNHPTDLASVNKMWLKKNDITGEWEAVTAQLKPNDSAEQVFQKTEAFEENMAQLAESDPDHYKRGKDLKDIPYRVLGNNLSEHQVYVKMGGQDYIITINGNPRVAQAVNGLSNPDSNSKILGGKLVDKVRSWTRWMAQNFTTRNPEFVLSNFLRDATYANTTIRAKEPKNYAVRYNQNFTKVGKWGLDFGKRGFGFMLPLILKYEKGTLDMNNEMEKAFKEFMQNGGETGYTHIRSVEENEKDVEKYLKMKDGKAPLTTAYKWLTEHLDYINRSVENRARFAAFLTSRQMGRTVERSVMDAKEVSVNFNKKGAGSQYMDKAGQTRLGNAVAGLTDIATATHVFFNAGVQGDKNFAGVLKHAGAKAVKYVAYLFLAGLANAAWGGGDDDKYKNLTPYERRNNICFKVPGTDMFVKIPLGVEFRTIYGLGELAGSMIRGYERMSPEEIMSEIAGLLSQVSPIDMMEGGKPKGKNLLPSLVRPEAELYDNEDFMGRRIHNKTDWNGHLPEWKRAGKHTNASLIKLSRKLNEWTQFTDEQYIADKGLININPSVVEHLVEGHFGGLATFFNKGAKVVEYLFSDEGDDMPKELELRNIPMASRVLTTADENAEARRVNNEFYKYYNEYLNTKKLVNMYSNQQDEGVIGAAEKYDFLYNSPEYGRYEIVDDKYDEIRDKQNELKEEVDPQERQRLEEDITELKREMIEAVREYDDERKRK